MRFKESERQLMFVMYHCGEETVGFLLALCLAEMVQTGLRNS
jgi:hypothetical protein